MFVQYVKLIFNGHPQTAISPLCPTLRRQHLNICREFWISDLFTGDEAHHLQHLDIFGQSQLIYYFQGTLRLDSWSSNEQLQCWPSESLICLIFIRGWRLHPNIFWIRSLRCLFTVSRKISVMSYLGSSKDWRVKKCKAPGPETILNCITKLLSIVIRSMWRYISALWQWRKLWPFIVLKIKGGEPNWCSRKAVAKDVVSGTAFLGRKILRNSLYIHHSNKMLLRQLWIDIVRRT